MLASARIKRWALILSAYDYKVEYKPGAQNSNADALSRLPLPESMKSVPLPGETILVMENLQASPVNVKQIRQWTDRDPVLSKVRRLVQEGWETNNDEQLRPYQNRKEELSVQDSCVMWEVPSVLHEMAWLQHVKHEVYIHEMTCISEVAKFDLLVILCPAYRYNQICKRSSRDLESARNNWKRVGMCTTSLWNCRSVNYNSESL